MHQRLSRVDLIRAALMLARSKMDGAELRLSDALRQFVQRARSELIRLMSEGGWPASEQKEARWLGTEIDVLIAAHDRAPPDQLATLARARAQIALDQLAEATDTGHSPQLLEAQLTAISAQAYMALQSGSDADRSQLDTLLEGARKIVRRTQLPRTESAIEMADVMSDLANKFILCSRTLDGYEMLHDVLRLIGKGSDVQAIVRRANVLARMGLAQMQLGRPDLASATIASVIKMLEASNPTAGSSRARQKASMGWWPASMRFEMDATEAWEELTRCREGSVREMAAAGETYRAYDANDQIEGIDGWLPAIAIRMGRFDLVPELFDRKDEDLARRQDIELDTRRVRARLFLSKAQAAYCVEDDAISLGAIKDGLACNANGARTLGDHYLALQVRLELFREEISAFRGDEVDVAALSAAVEAMQEIARRREGDSRGRDWFHWDRVETGEILAIAAATYLRIGDTVTARNIAARVVDAWGAELRAAEPGDLIDWLTELARPGQVIANAVCAVVAGGGAGSTTGTASDSLGGVVEPYRARYRRILAFLQRLPYRSG